MTTTPTLPPLPEAMYEQDTQYGKPESYDAVQMEAYALAAYQAGRDSGLEEAKGVLSALCTESLKARIPEHEDDEGWNQGCLERSLALTDAMLKIRALKSDAKGGV